LITQINTLQSQAQVIYSNLLNEKDRLEADLIKYFHVINIVFDPTNYSIKVTFPMNVKNYSSGEKHLISFLFKLYSFIGSDKSILLLDDPASSLDLINH